MRPSLLLLLALTLACQSQPTTETGTAKTDSVASSGSVDLTKKPSPEAPRHAADRLVRMLYFEHDNKENPFLKAPDRAMVDQFFTTETGDLVWQRARKTATRPAISPLFNTPDNGIEKRWVLPATVSGDKAVVFVTFNQLNVPKEMRLEMALQPTGRWRITDIVYADGSRLSGK